MDLSIWSPLIFLRRAMIVELFTGGYNNDIAKIAPLSVFAKLLRALLAT